ncbi:MAG: hypothetical protein ACRDHW_24290, partial [Ktedonobacteraceae bacterium]
MNGLLRPGKRQHTTELAKRSRTRFTVRSLGGKLVLVAALTLLFCMLLFVAISWGLVRAFYERQASSDANLHLTSLSQVYGAQSSQRLQHLAMLTTRPEVSGTLQHQAGTQASLTTLLTDDLVHERLLSLALVGADSTTLVQVGESSPNTGQTLLNAGLKGHEGSELVPQEQGWNLVLEAPVQTTTGKIVV